MRKIVPFNNVLSFNTDVCEITAISLEHDINTTSDLISGQFHISGEYKITDGDILREEFNFDLPFDIALGQEYDRNTLVVDIDDFRYELVDRNKLKVNIDLYIDGEIIVEEKNDSEMMVEQEEVALGDEGVQEGMMEEEDNNNEGDIDETLEEEMGEDNLEVEPERIELLDEMLKDKEEDSMENVEINNENVNNNNNDNNNDNSNNIFSGFNEEEKYVTYRVHRVMETDTIDKLLEEYNITKEELSKYNVIENIKPGDKLIIPTNDK